jgi:hypothetical protein
MGVAMMVMIVRIVMVAMVVSEGLDPVLIVVGVMVYKNEKMKRKERDWKKGRRKDEKEERRARMAKGKADRQERRNIGKKIEIGEGRGMRPGKKSIATKTGGRKGGQAGRKEGRQEDKKREGRKDEAQPFASNDFPINQ